MNLKQTVKGYVGEQNGAVYYCDLSNVYRAQINALPVPDARTGYLQGRWECSVSHWNQYRDACYPGMPKIAWATMGQSHILLVNEKMERIDAIIPDPFPESMAEAVDRMENKHGIRIVNFDREKGLFML